MSAGTRAMMVKTKAVVNEVDMASMNLPQHGSDAGGSEDGSKQPNVRPPGMDPASHLCSSFGSFP